MPPTPPAPPLTRLGHNCRCSGCNAYINGSRYQCANCPSDPVAFNLVRSSFYLTPFRSFSYSLANADASLDRLSLPQCSTCERRSYQLHDPLHVFLRFDRPVDFEVKARAPLFPVLYKKPAGTSSDPNLPVPQVGSASMEMRNLGDPSGEFCFPRFLSSTRVRLPR